MSDLMDGVPVAPPRRRIAVTIDGSEVLVPEGDTILQACRTEGIDTPTLCYLENLTPVNVCRACVVEVDGNRALVPACSRPVEENMVIHTDSERVQHSRKLVLEMLGSSVDLSQSSSDLARWMENYKADPERLGDENRATKAQPVKIEDELYVRDYSRCILCYKCVEACGEDAQWTFAIAVSGRGFDAEISTEFAATLPESACVYCGNCIGVCPTNALQFKSEFDLRRAGDWKPEEQTVTETICSYCGVGCSLELHVQDDEIVKVTSPMDSTVTNGHLCIKGRFGFQYVQNR